MPWVHTVGTVVDHAAEILAAAECDNPQADAEEIVAAVLGFDSSRIQDHRAEPISEPARAQIAAHTRRRRDREPLAYITGQCSYRGLILAIDPRVLVPHAQSGQLVDIALRLPFGARVHDVGTGAGPIALSIKSERPDLAVTGSDVSAEAVDVARENAARLRLDVQFVVADGVPPGDYDLVVADLPYGDRPARIVPQPPESRYQPEVAHYGGTDGHETICKVVHSIRSGTRMAIQHAVAQSDVVRALLAEPDTFGDPQYSARFTVGRVF
jgi:release factor glutamine methyltransferase